MERFWKQRKFYKFQVCGQLREDELHCARTEALRWPWGRGRWDSWVWLVKILVILEVGGECLGCWQEILVNSVDCILGFLDSGTLARYSDRPRFGYLLDGSVQSLCERSLENWLSMPRTVRLPCSISTVNGLGYKRPVSYVPHSGRSDQIFVYILIRVRGALTFKAIQKRWSYQQKQYPIMAFSFWTQYEVLC